MTAVLTASRSYVPLHVVPDIFPAQARLPAHERDLAVARRLGAEWVPGARHMRVGVSASAEHAKRLVARFSGPVAKARADAAYADLAPPVDRLRMARAALVEVVKAGQVPPRSLPAADVPKSQRRYFFTVRDTGSPFSAAAFDLAAHEARFTTHIDCERGSAGFGLRYAADGAPVPESLKSFLSGPARAAMMAARERQLDSRALMIDAANTLAGPNAIVARPLAVPKRAADPEGYDAARSMLASLPAERREAWLTTTRRAALDMPLRPGSPFAMARANARQRALDIGEDLEARESRPVQAAPRTSASELRSEVARPALRAPLEK